MIIKEFRITLPMTVEEQTIVRYYVRLFDTILDIQREKVFGNDTRYFKKILFDNDTILYQIIIR